MYIIDELRQNNKEENIVISLHGQIRLSERKISVDDVIKVIDTGEIIEEYPDDFPFESCLVLGRSINERKLHVVVSMNEGIIYLITAYYPDEDRWEADLKTRKR